MKKILLLVLIFITSSSYKEPEVSTEARLTEIRQNLVEAEMDLKEVSEVISDKKELKRIKKRIGNEIN